MWPNAGAAVEQVGNLRLTKKGLAPKKVELLRKIFVAKLFIYL